MGKSFLSAILLSCLLAHVHMVSIMSWNVRGIISSTMCLSSLLEPVDCDIVVISEHKLKSESAMYLDSIHRDYFSITKIDQSTNDPSPVTPNFVGKGGVAFMIKKSLQFCVKD